MAIDRRRVQRLERWREALRRQEEARTRLAYGDYRRALELLERAQESRWDLHQQLAGAVTAGGNGVEVQWLSDLWQGARDHQQIRGEQSQQAEQLLNQRRQQLVEARREERVLETFDERLGGEQRRQELLQEQKLLDDLPRREVKGW